jgi:DNA-binding XRE family transcriptional regulator
MTQKAVNELLAENVRYYMQLREIKTQEALAKKVGVVQRTIGYYLNPSTRTASKSGKEPSAKLAEVESLAKALQVEIWQLLMPPSTRDYYARIEETFKAVQKVMAEQHAAVEPATPEKPRRTA